MCLNKILAVTTATQFQVFNIEYEFPCRLSLFGGFVSHNADYIASLYRESTFLWEASRNG